MVVCAFSDLITRKLPSRIIEVPDNGGPDNRGSTVVHVSVTFDYLCHMSLILQTYSTNIQCIKIFTINCLFI